MRLKEPLHRIKLSQKSGKKVLGNKGYNSIKKIIKG